VDRPGEIHRIDAFDARQMSAWSAVSPHFLFIQRPSGASCGQVARMDPDTGVLTMLTRDEGEKNDPGLFRAPEFGGEICLLTRVNNRFLAVYRDLGSPDGSWTCVATLGLPAGSPHEYIFSTEIIAPSTGVGGVSYFTLNASRENDWGGRSDRAIWVLGLGADPQNRFARRVDDAALSGAAAVRMEPEPFMGRDEVFVYYNYFDPLIGEHGLRRARTGIPCGCPGGRQGDLDGDGRVTAVDLVTLSETVAGNLPPGAPPCLFPACADLSGDGRVESSDVVLLALRVAEGMAP
jgi:hypothetical protein